MIPVVKAIKLVLENTPDPAGVTAGIQDAAGLVLAEDVVSPLDFPPFGRALMDGYAVRAADTEPGRTMTVTGVIAAGDTPKDAVGPDECMKIMTGAPLPGGADSVVKIEDTDGGTKKVKINVSVKAGNYVTPTGAVVGRNAVLFHAGHCIRVQDIALLATCNFAAFKVFGRPTASVISSGNELIEVGEHGGKGGIPDVNRYTLHALLEREGIEADFLGIARDDKESIRELVRRGLERDVLIISGGVSMGDYDFVGRVLEEEGVDPVFTRVKLKPGKPTFFGKKGKNVIFGLPGNPMSVFVTFNLFVRTALWKMAGRGDMAVRFSTGRVLGKTLNGIERTEFRPARAFMKGRVLHASVLGSLGSGDVGALSRANAFVVVPPAPACIRDGETAEVYLLDEI